jgi:hypothetical protein
MTQAASFAMTVRLTVMKTVGDYHQTLLHREPNGRHTVTPGVGGRTVHRQ